MIGKIVLCELKRDKLRSLSVMLGVAVSTVLLVWAFGFLMTSMAQFTERVRHMTEPYSCWVSPTKVGSTYGRRKPAKAEKHRTPPPQNLPADMADALLDVKGVERADRFSVLTASIDYRPNGRALQGPSIKAGIVQIPTNEIPAFSMPLQGSWPDPQSDEPECVIFRSVFTPRNFAPPPVGSDLTVLSGEAAVKIRVAGVIDVREGLSGFPSMFVTRGAMERLSGSKPVDIILCQTSSPWALRSIRELVDHYDYGQYADCVVDRSIVEKALTNDKLANFKKQLPLLLTLSVLTALCILVNMLNMGLEKRRRLFGLIRCIGATRGQLLRIVVFEALLLSLAGWILGILVGWGILAAVTAESPELFPEGAALGWVTPVASLVIILVVFMIAVIFPSIRMMKLRPLDACAPVPKPDKGLSLTKTVLGILLMVPMPFLALPLKVSALTVSLLILFVGLPLFLLGLWLALPPLMRSAEKLLMPLFGRFSGLNKVFLGSRVMRYTTFQPGVVVTLAIGLSMYMAIHIWGASLTKPFLPSETLPDVIVDFLPGGISQEQVQRIGALPGIKDGMALPIEATQVPISDAIGQAIAKASGKAPDRRVGNFLVLGVDPVNAFDAQGPLNALRFVEGEAEQAARKLKSGKKCVITKMFSRQSGLHVGDSLSFTAGSPGRRDGRERAQNGKTGRQGDDVREKTRNLRENVSPGRGPSGPQKRNISSEQDLEIAGVVDLQWHLVTSRGHLRGRNGFGQGTLGPVFVAEQSARRLTRNRDKTYYLWLNFDEQLAAQPPLEGSQLLEQRIREVCGSSDAHTVRVHHRDEIEDGTIAHGAEIIGDMARIPFYSIIILSFGMITLIIGAAERSAGEIRIMRAVGMSRRQLGKVLFFDALLTAFIGALVSLFAGLCIGWTFTGWTRAGMPFGGLPVLLSIPWKELLKGFLLMLGMCTIISAIPVWRIVNRADTDLKTVD